MLLDRKKYFYVTVSSHAESRKMSTLEDRAIWEDGEVNTNNFETENNLSFHNIYVKPTGT